MSILHLKRGEFPTPEMIEAAWQAYQNCLIDLCGDHDEEQKKSVVAALRAALSASPSPVDSRDGLEAARMAHRETLDLLHIRNEKLNAAEQRIERLTKALEWYGEQAGAAARHSIVINSDALSDVVMTLSLDGGERARAALLAAKEQQP